MLHRPSQRFVASRHENCGFTLVELLVVLGLVATLSAVVLGAVGGAKRRAAVAQARAELAAIALDLERYGRAHGGFPASGDECLTQVDPWGRPYRYVTFERAVGADETHRGFVLYSLGAASDDSSPPSPREVVPETSGARGGLIASGARSAGLIIEQR